MISIDTVNQKSYNAGSKAREDVTYFLKKKGVSSFSIDGGSSRFLLVRELHRLSCLFLLWKTIDSTEKVIIQYPLNINIIDNFFLRMFLKERRVKYFFIIHDLISVQGFNPDKKIQEEIKEFNGASGVITHNDSMSNFLLENGLKVKHTSINFFDYHVKEDEGCEDVLRDFNHLAFAGNLAKSKFLLKIPRIQNMTWDIFGKGLPPSELPNFVNYHGAVDPDVLPSVLPKGWGLVWDGDEADTISGQGGVYLQLNSPHKASLYLASGLPLVVWQESALANFVLTNHLGITINSLNEIDFKIQSLGEDQLVKIERSVFEFSKLITGGDMIGNALFALS